MGKESVTKLSQMALEKGQGILRLTPTWVPRVFCVPGRRIKLHPDDYYALGSERGGIEEILKSHQVEPLAPAVDQALEAILAEADCELCGAER